MRIALATLALAGCLVVPALSATAPLRVLYVGDSLTAGALVTDLPHSFPWLVTAGLKRRGDTVTQLVRAKPGSRTAYWKAAAIPANIDVAVVEMGTNDAPYTPHAQFDTDYRNLLAMIRAKSPHARLVCLSVWRPLGAPGAENDGTMDAVIKAACPGRYVNILRFAHAPNLGKDGFHPNNAGHALIAKAILIALG